MQEVPQDIAALVAKNMALKAQLAVHTACWLQVKAWQAAHKRWATGRNFFEALRSFLCRILFRSWDELMEFLASDKGVPASSLGRRLP